MVTYIAQREGRMYREELTEENRDRETVDALGNLRAARATLQRMYVRISIRIRCAFLSYLCFPFSRLGHCYFYSQHTVARMICEAGGVF